MKLIRLLALAAAAAYVYKRFFAGSEPILGGSGAGTAETEAAEPFSSEQLGDAGGAPAEAAAEGDGGDAGSGSGAAEGGGDAAGEDGGERPDPLTRPSWLSPADAG